MEFMSLDNVPDPNKDQNRVPLDAELNTLRSIRTQKQHIADTIASQLAVAKESHIRIEARYQKLLQEIESTQSELNISRDYINMLEAQHHTLRAEDERLAGLLHPVRRCHQDILRIIFQHATGANKAEWFQLATKISHVCKRWRAIVLGMSILWTQINISVNDDPNDAMLFMERSRPRVRSTPVEVTISGIGEKLVESTKSLMEHLQLNLFGCVDRLNLELRSPTDITQITQSTLATSPASIKYIQVDGNSRLDGARPIWNFAWMLTYFSNAETLQLDRLGTVDLEGVDTFPSLQKLWIENVCMPTIASHLPRLPNLKELEVSGRFELLPPIQDIIMPNLESIKIRKVKSFPWSKVTAPRVSDIFTNDKHPDVISFFCRHPTIRYLNYQVNLTQNNFNILALNLPQLEIFSMYGNFDQFIKRPNPDASFPPFPRTLVLETRFRGDQLPSAQDAEEFIKLRCLPNSASERGEISLLSSWILVGNVRELKHLHWRTSPLLADCQQTVKTGEASEVLGVLILQWER